MTRHVLASVILVAVVNPASAQWSMTDVWNPYPGRTIIEMRFIDPGPDYEAIAKRDRIEARRKFEAAVAAQKKQEDNLRARGLIIEPSKLPVRFQLEPKAIEHDMDLGCYILKGTRGDEVITVYVKPINQENARAELEAAVAKKTPLAIRASRIGIPAAGQKGDVKKPVEQYVIAKSVAITHH